MGRGQLVHPLEDRGRVGDVAVRQVAVDGQRVDRAGHVARGQGEQRLQLAGEQDPLAPLVEPVDQGLLAEAVAAEHQGAPGGVPDGQGEHAAEQGEHARALVLVEVDEHLGVAVGAEGMSARLEAVAEGGEVVDLAVEDGPDGAVLIGQRLVAAGKVDDGEPTEPERGVCVAVGALIVGPAVHDPVSHRRQGVVVRPAARVSPGRADDPAHGSNVPGSNGR